MENSRRAAVIGLGSMGFGAAASLLRAGFTVHGVDPRPEPRERFAAAGGIAHDGAAAAVAEAEVVVILVVDAAQTETVLFGAGGAVAAARPGTVFLLSATMAPSAAAALAARVVAAGMLVLDAPVSGGSQRALAGEMTVMAAGSDAAFAAAGAALDAIATRVFRLGREPGQGSKVKMINQLLAGVHIAAAAEALTLAAAEGIDLAAVYDVIKVSAGNSWMFENRGEHIVSGDYTPRSAVAIFVKDLGIVAREAAGVGADVPLARSALALFEAAVAAGLGAVDDAAVAQILARRSGVALPGMEA